MENGAVTASYHSADKFSKDETVYDNGTTYTYWEYYNYAYESKSTNHAIAIVGWDDTISKEKFTIDGTYTPEGDGAWLIKNSWIQSQSPQ